MIDAILKRLKSSDYAATLGFIATPSALRRALARSNEVHEIRQSLETGELSEDAIRAYVQSLMTALRRGTPFRHDLVVSTLAVALERRPTHFADEFIRDLAQVKAAEMNMSSRVASECLKARSSISGNTVVVRKLADPPRGLSVNYGDLQYYYPRQHTRQEKQTVTFGLEMAAWSPLANQIVARGGW